MSIADPHIRSTRPRRPNYAAEEPMHPLQVQHYRAMTPAQKLDHLAKMYRLGRSIMAAGVRMRSPELNDDEVEKKVRVLILYGSA